MPNETMNNTEVLFTPEPMEIMDVPEPTGFFGGPGFGRGAAFGATIAAVATFGICKVVPWWMNKREARKAKKADDAETPTLKEGVDVEVVDKGKKIKTK